MMTDIDLERPTILVTGADGRTRHAITNKIDEAGEDYLVVTFADNENAARQMGAFAYLDIAVIDTSTVGAPHRTDLPQQIHTRWPKAGIIVTSMNNSDEPDNLPEGARFIFEPHKGDVLLSHIKEFLLQQGTI